MPNQNQRTSQSIADTLSFSGKSALSTVTNCLIIAAFAFAFLAPPPANDKVFEEKFQARSTIAAHNINSIKSENSPQKLAQLQ